MKKTDNITFRTDRETKDALIKIANSKKWSLSLLVEDIVQQWLNTNTAVDNALAEAGPISPQK